MVRSLKRLQWFSEGSLTLAHVLALSKKMYGIQSKKAPRPGAFLLPKPKPMRRITLLSQYNGRLLFLVAMFLKKSGKCVSKK